MHCLPAIGTRLGAPARVYLIAQPDPVHPSEAAGQTEGDEEDEEKGQGQEKEGEGQEVRAAWARLCETLRVLVGAWCSEEVALRAGRVVQRGQMVVATAQLRSESDH